MRLWVVVVPTYLFARVQTSDGQSGSYFGLVKIEVQLRNSLRRKFTMTTNQGTFQMALNASFSSSQAVDVLT